MGMHDTTASEMATKLLRRAQRNISELQLWLDKMDQEIETHEKCHKGKAFPISWCEEMMKKALSIYSDVARRNGAALVVHQTTEQAKKPKESPLM